MLSSEDDLGSVRDGRRCVVIVRDGWRLLRQVVVDHREEQLDRDEHRNGRPSSERLADRIRATDRDIRGEARSGADDERDPWNPTDGSTGATLCDQVETGTISSPSTLIGNAYDFQPSCP